MNIARNSGDDGRTNGQPPLALLFVTTRMSKTAVATATVARILAAIVRERPGGGGGGGGGDGDGGGGFGGVSDVRASRVYARAYTCVYAYIVIRS